MTTRAGRATAPARSADSSTLQRLHVCALFAAAWAAASFAGGVMMPFPNVPQVGAKWRYFAEHKDRFDTIFVGSSRMHSQIIPAEFEAEMAAAGAPAHSFNLAYAGMWPPESCYFLGRILALRSAKLKWVLIDLMDVNSRIEKGNEGSQRDEYWHDLPHTWMAWRDAIESARPWPEKRARLWRHGCLFLRRLANAGRGAEWLEARMIPAKAPRPPGWATRGGFEPGPEEGLTGSNLDRFLEAVAWLKNGVPRHPGRSVLHDALRQMAAGVRRAGAEPVFILAPTINAKDNFGDLPQELTVLAFNEPARYPVLFEPGLHFDAWHFNERGAVIYTRLLARRFAEWRRSRVSLPARGDATAALPIP